MTADERPRTPRRDARTAASTPSGAERWEADRGLEELYSAHYRSLVRLSMLLLADQESAEEVVQDAFVAMHRRWRRLREPEKALAYVRQAVVNRSRSLLRRRGVQARHLVPDPTEPRPDDPAQAVVRRAAVLAALQQLPERQREVLALRYYADLDEAAIATALGISRGSVKKHASRGASALRTLLREEAP